MSQTAQAPVVVLAAPESARRPSSAVYEITKPRITRLVTITAGVGFGLGALGRPWSLGELALTGLACLGGTALSSGGANALNQWMERGRDAIMPRTAGRPLPQGRISPAGAAFAGAAMCVAGVVVLWAAIGAVPALTSLATILIYLALYTPSKTISPLSTLVGAVPGALPPVIGWTAARADLGLAALADPGCWALFLIMFVWQIPHFLAIAWMYRDDYAVGGYKVLPCVDPDGSRTAAAILAWSALLVPVTIAPAALIRLGPGPGYVAVALVTGLAFFYLAARLTRTRTREDARTTFIASVIHLPLLLLVLVADSLIAAIW